MSTELKKEYVALADNTVKCTNRETKATSEGRAYTFDIVLDFAGISEATVRNWAAATAIIRVQNKLRDKGEEFLKACEKAGSYTVKLTAMREMDVESAVRAMTPERKKALLAQLQAEFGDMLS
jgi:hypothetical protein